MRIPIDRSGGVVFGAYVARDSSPADVKALAGKYIDFQRLAIGPALSAFVTDAVDIELAGRDQYPLPAEHLLTHGEYTDDERQRFARATQVVVARAADGLRAPRFAIWATQAATWAAASDLNGIVWDPSCVRFIPTAAEPVIPSDGKIVMTKHVRIWHSVQDSGLSWMTTTGMDKFGLPNLEIVDYPPHASHGLMHLTNTVASKLARHVVDSDLPPPAVLKLSTDDLDAAYGEPQPIYENSRGGTEVGLEYPGGRDRDGHFIRLVPPIDVRDSVVWLEQTLADLLGSKDEISLIEPGSLETAREMALEKVPYVKHRFKSGLPPGQVLYVKAPFPFGDGKREFMWVAITRWDSTRLMGHLANDPTYRSDLVAGQQVDVDEREIYNWMIRDGIQTVEGNFHAE